MPKPCVLFAVCLISAAAVLVQTGSGVSAASGAEPSGTSDVGRLAWMAGSWASDSAGIRIEEHWMAPSGGLMVGMHRDVAGGRATSFEFLRIEAGPQGIAYLSSPRGQPATPFPLREIGDRSVVFENPEHDFPQRVLYWLDTAGRLHARIDGSMRGSPASENWCWKRSELVPKSAGRTTPRRSNPPGARSK